MRDIVSRMHGSGRGEPGRSLALASVAGCPASSCLASQNWERFEPGKVRRDRKGEVDHRHFYEIPSSSCSRRFKPLARRTARSALQGEPRILRLRRNFQWGAADVRFGSLADIRATMRLRPLTAQDRTCRIDGGSVDQPSACRQV